MSNSLIGVREKIKRAKHHINDLECRLRVFDESNPYVVVREMDPNVGERFKIREIHKLPIEVAVVAGEAIHQLRSSLDHLACRLVEACGNDPGTRTYFPIYKGPAEYVTDEPGKKKGISNPAAISVLDGLQPYRGGNDLLWMLDKLNNIDKHNVLLVVTAHLGPGTATLVHTSPGGSAVEGFGWDLHTIDSRRKLCVLEDGADYLVMVGTSPANVEVNLKASYQIVFGNPGVGLGEPVVSLLHQFAGLVNGIVDQFAPFL